MITTDLSTANGETWGTLIFSSVLGAGRIYPRLAFAFTARTSRENRRAQIVHLNARLLMERELLGQGAVTQVGAEVMAGDTPLQLDVPVSHHALHYIQEHVRGSTLSLSLEWAGLLRVRRDKAEAAELELGSFLPSGEWHVAPIRAATTQVPIARSDWIKQVLEPIGVGEYILIDIPVPPFPHRERWQHALAHLQAAEEHFLVGNDAEVLSRCRAAFESLDGAPKQIFDSVADETKRKHIDELLLKTATYLHAGRHPSKSGPQQGQFAVDHRDAEFALGVSRLFLVYIAKLLQRS